MKGNQGIPTWKRTHLSMSDLMRKFDLDYPAIRRLVDNRVLIPDDLQTQEATLFRKDSLPDIRRAIRGAIKKTL